MVHRTDFAPSPNDKTGLSVIRSGLRSAKDAAVNPNRTDVKYLLVELAVSDIRALGLNVEPEPDEVDEKNGGEPAHAVIPELNTAARQNNKSKVTDWSKRLQVLASLTPIIDPSSSG